MCGVTMFTHTFYFNVHVTITNHLRITIMEEKVLMFSNAKAREELEAVMIMAKNLIKMSLKKRRFSKEVREILLHMTDVIRTDYYKIQDIELKRLKKAGKQEFTDEEIDKMINEIIKQENGKD